MDTQISKNGFLYAKLTGLSLMLMAVVAGFSFGFVLNELYVAGDIVKTNQNIEANVLLYNLGNLGWLLIMVLDLLVSVGLYQVYKAKARRLTLVMASLRLLYAPMLGVGILGIFNRDIGAFMYHWELGLIVFGLHLVSLYVLNNHFNRQVPRWIGYLLLVAGLSYSLIHSIHLFAPQWVDEIKNLENLLVLPMSLSELLLAFWLLRSRKS